MPNLKRLLLRYSDMKIVQLSDIHVGAQFREEVFDQVAGEVNDLKPSAIGVTGDLRNEGLVQEYERCKEKFAQFETEKIIAISGNHDYRNTGYLLFKKFFPFDSVNELDEDIVLVTLGTARPDRDEGEVGYRQNLWLERTMKKYEKKTKILAMHHHLIRVPSFFLMMRYLRLQLRGYQNSRTRVCACVHILPNLSCWIMLFVRHRQNQSQLPCLYQYQELQLGGDAWLISLSFFRTSS